MKKIIEEIEDGLLDYFNVPHVENQMDIENVVEVNRKAKKSGKNKK